MSVPGLGVVLGTQGHLVRVLNGRHQVGYLVCGGASDTAIHLDTDVRRDGQLVLWHQPTVRALGVQVGLHLAFAFDVHRPSVVELIAHLAQDAVALLTDLDAALHARGVHPAGDVDRVPPDVVEQLGGADDARRQGPMVEAHPELEVEPQHVVVEVVHHTHHLLGKLKEDLQVLLRVAAVAALRGVQPRCCHVRGPDGLDLLDAAVVRLAQELVEVPDQLVEDPVALLAALVVLLVELAEVHDAGEDDASTVVVLGVGLGHLQLLSHVVGDDVPQQPVGLVPHALDLGSVQVRLHVPVVVQAVADFELSVQEPDQQEQEEEDENYLLADQAGWAPAVVRQRGVAQLPRGAGGEREERGRAS